MIKGNKQAFQNVSPGQRLVELEPAPARNDFLLVSQVIGQHFLQRQYTGMAIHEGQHDDAKAFLELCVLVQLVQGNVRICISPQLDDDTHALTVRFIPQSSDTFDVFIA